MITRIVVFLGIILAGVISAQAQIQITGFGSVGVNPLDPSTDLESPWTGTQSLDSVTVSDVSNFSGGIFSVLATPVDISSVETNLTLTGALTTAEPSTDKFQLQLFDTDFNSISYNFTWSAFANGTQTVTVPEIDLEGFNGTVSSYSLNLFGAPMDAPVSFTFNDLEAGIPAEAPEPSVCMLWILGLGLIGVFHYRRASLFFTR